MDGKSPLTPVAQRREPQNVEMDDEYLFTTPPQSPVVQLQNIRLVRQQALLQRVRHIHAVIVAPQFGLPDANPNAPDSGANA